MMTHSLSEQQLKQYREEGYVILDRLMDDATLEELQAEEARFRGERDPKELTVFRSQLCNYSEPIRRFCQSGPHVPLLRQLIGPNVAFWFNQFVTKWPDSNTGKSEFPWHQDNGYTAVEPATNLTIWFALDDVDERNGCVWVQPGSHKRGLLDHKPASADNWHLTAPAEGDGVPARLRAGGAVAFSALTLHRSKLNHTDKPRRAFFVGYADARAVYYNRRHAQPKPEPVVETPHGWMVFGQLEWPPPANRKLY